MQNTTALRWQVISDSSVALEDLHQPDFMNVAWPMSTRFQDERMNQWTLEPAARI